MNKVTNALTEKEHEILQLICDGYSHGEISKILCISPSTTRTHYHNIYTKSGTHRLNALVNWAVRKGHAFIEREYKVKVLHG